MINCILIGEQSLLVQCGEHLLEQGHAISAVVGSSETVTQWCGKRALQCFPTVKALNASGFLDANPFDYLFSITNLKMLPASLLEKAGKAAINFHDGPLPKYAGLNAPVWALIAGEQEHGISWHIMTAEADNGDLLQQQCFPIVPGETVFTLNAKCYQAGLEAFHLLERQLASDSLQTVSQDHSEFTYYGLRDRPSAAATICWTDPAHKIVALVNALDFGPYANPVTAAKIYLGREVVLVGSAELSDLPAGVEAGQLLAIDEQSIVVAAQEGAVRLGKVTANCGREIDLVQLLASNGFSEGEILPTLSVDQIKAIDEQFQSCAAYENYWIDQLARFETVEFPYAKVSQAQAVTREISVPGGGILMKDSEADPVPAQQTLAATVLLLLGRLGMKQAFGVGISVTSEVNPALPAGYFSDVQPCLVDLQEQSFSQFQASVAQIIKACVERQRFALDVLSREPRLVNTSWAPNIALRLSSDGETPAESEGFDLVIDIPQSADHVRFVFGVASEESAQSFVEHFAQLLEEVQKSPDQLISQHSVVSAGERETLSKWNATHCDAAAFAPVHRLIEAQVEQTPSSMACVFEGQQLTYSQLNRRANQLANYLIAQGLNPEDRVGVLLDRSIEMLVTLLGVLKAGCCYVPLDPVYPADRIEYMAEDAGLKIALFNSQHARLVANVACQKVVIESVAAQIDAATTENPLVEVNAQSLAYVIYTSGSTGKPKGVMVEHGNVVNFFDGMDERLESGPGTWLAVTSISFDISVLELFWTLSRGLSIVLYADERRQKTAAKFQSAYPQKNIDFNLFYWNVAEDESEYDEEKYRLLIEGAKFADQNGFNAVWTPERHFAAFGGLFPNPSVTSAALATITNNVELRGGSCVAPLHSPIRIAEEWAVVDNLSNGRTGIAVASGWAPPDFAIKPENFANAKAVMFETAETVRQLWRGETVNFPGPSGDEVAVRTLPRPIQKELPLWVTTAGNVDSFTQAGEIGANLLTHLLGQTVEEVAEKVSAYRDAWKKAGHPGQGKVTLMLHTFVGPDADTVEAAVREPLKRYLKSAMFLVKAAAWQFPTFKQMSEEQGKTLDEFFDTISDEDMDGLLEFAFQRYFNTSGLFGTVESCLPMVDKVKGADIDEIGCLIDFGIDTQVVLNHLPYLSELLTTVKEVAPSIEDVRNNSIPALLDRYDVTHFQCTPSMATMLAHDPACRPGLAKLKQMMVGGEAFPPELATELSALVSGKVTNMYGPTETTIWSSTADVLADRVAVERTVTIGSPLANQRAYVLDDNQQPLPIGVAGELVIGGKGVVRGYHNREDLTAERFVDDPFEGGGARMYRTGDLARWRTDGTLECLGRVDSQIKIRGYRVELGEIEAYLRNHPTVLEAAVILREDTPGDQRLVAYVSHKPNTPPIEGEKLKAFVGQELPVFMVPSIIVEMPVLPRTPNGKIDRKSLPEPKNQLVAGRKPGRAPANEAEQMISKIWKRALGIAEVGVRDNFFDVGGHSLLVVQVLKELREKTAKSIQMTDLFRYTTIETLAAYIAEDNQENQALDKAQDRAAQRKAAAGRRRRRR